MTDKIFHDCFMENDSQHLNERKLNETPKERLFKKSNLTESLDERKLNATIRAMEHLFKKSGRFITLQTIFFTIFMLHSLVEVYVSAMLLVSAS